jgi:ABC-type sugar transport system ATPase subunit
MADKHSPVIQVRNITKQFPGVLALDQVSLSVYPGEIHGVIGENGAGKSTLMNILAGEVQPDSGKIMYMGKERQIPNAHVSQQMGISVVYQELALCPNLSIAENISLNTAGTRPGLSLVNRRELMGTAKESLARLGMEKVDLNQRVGRLSVAQQQLVEIAKAISIKAEVLILDEPNSALTQEETEHLFTVLTQLRDSGVAIVYVSHRLEEVLCVADRITILRDGTLIDTVNTAETSIERLIAKMVGRAIDGLYQRTIDSAARPEIAFEVRNLSSEHHVIDVSFSVHAGEIVGIAGLPDAGKDELIECCFGLRPYGGEILVKGSLVAINSPASAIERGLAFVPADRRESGALLVLDVPDNVVAASLKAVSRWGVLNQPRIRALTQEYVDQLDIRIASLAQQMGTLSGGNQQKVIVARGLATNPSVLLLHEPTRGIDVGAKAEIYAILQNLASQGVAAVIVSSELPELVGQCDRLLVMWQGHMVAQFNRDEAEEELILTCAMGQTVQR